MRLTFLGATQTVTGSRFLVESDAGAVLVDCGLFQGIKRLRERNRETPPLDPARLSAVLLTHAHLDHSGLLPVLVRDGFAGPIFCTAATAELCRLLLPDSGRIHEEEAAYANRHGTSRHRPALPLFTEEDAKRSLVQFRPIDFDAEFVPLAGLRARFRANGHLPGSACVTLSNGACTIGFSGDVGRPHDPLMRPPEPLHPCDVLVLESTYGSRRHREQDASVVLADVVGRIASRGGTLVIPAFAVGRAQAVLHLLAELRHQGRIPSMPIFLDSPMASRATDVARWFKDQGRLTDEQTARMCSVATFTESVDQSKAIANVPAPKIVVSASGMATGGRVLHHLAACLPHAKNAVLLVGHQAAGTRGHLLFSGADELKIHGAYVPVRAEVVHVDALSGHADFVEMIEWLRATPRAPQRVFLVHGEPEEADGMRRHLKDLLGWRATIPEFGQRVDLGGSDRSTA